MNKLEKDQLLADIAEKISYRNNHSKPVSTVVDGVDGVVRDRLIEIAACSGNKELKNAVDMVLNYLQQVEDENEPVVSPNEIIEAIDKGDEIHRRHENPYSTERFERGFLTNEEKQEQKAMAGKVSGRRRLDKVKSRDEKIRQRYAQLTGKHAGRVRCLASDFKLNERTIYRILTRTKKQTI